MEKIKDKSVVLKVLGFSLAIAPALLVAILIYKNSVNVPFGDDWTVGFFLSKVFSENQLNLDTFIFQHNESRYAFPRLIFMVLTYMNNLIWDLRSQMWVSFWLACLIAVNIFYLIKLTVKGNFWKIILLTIISNSLIFATIQYGNWLWGIQLIVFMPMVCITTCLIVIYSGINRIAKLLICIILCTISTYSYANGMLLWVITLPIFALSKSWKWEGLFKEKWFYVGWFAAFISNIVVYFNKYNKPEGTPSFLYALTHLDQTIKYFLSFLGSSLGWGTVNYVNWENSNLVNHNAIIGLLLIILFLSNCAYFLKHYQDPEVIYRMSGWLTIGSYVVISALVTSLGRVGYGLETSYSVRYTSFSVYLPLVLINLIVIIYDDARNKNYLTKNLKLIAQSVMAVLLAIFLVLHWLTSVYAIPKYQELKQERFHAKSCLVFIYALTDEKCLKKKVADNISNLKQFVKMVDDANLLDAHLVGTTKVQNIQGRKNVSSDGFGYGAFDAISREQDSYVTGGWARLPKRKQPADAVLLTYEKGKDEDIIFAISDNNVERQDVAKVTKNQAYSMSGWQKTFPASSLPKGVVKIKAWAFDSETSKAYQLTGVRVINNQGI